MRMSWSKHKRISGTREIITLFFKRSKIHWWLIGLVFILATTWLIFPMEERRRLINFDEFKVGKESPKDVFAVIDFDYYEEIDTEEEKQNLLMEVPPVFELDFQALKKVEEEFNIVHQVRADQTLDGSAKIAKMQYLFYIGPSDKVGLILADASDEQLKVMKEETLRLLSDILSKGIIANKERGGFMDELSKIDYIRPKLNRIREELKRQTGSEPSDAQVADKIRISLVDKRLGTAIERTVFVEDLIRWSDAIIIARNSARELPKPISDVVEEMCVELLRPNLIYSPTYTQNEKERLMSATSSVSQRISEGDRIISAGEIVNESHIKKLKVIYSAQKKALLRAIPGVLLFTLILTYMLIMYLYRYEPLIFSEPRKLLALIITILFVLTLGNLVITRGPKLGLEYPGFLVPTALASIVVAILANVQLSIIATCIIGVFIAVLAGVGRAESFEYFLVILTSGVVASTSASNIRRRRHLITLGAYVSGVNVVTIFGLGFLGDMPITRLGTNCLVGAVNGAIVALLTPGLLPIFEYLSRTTTDIELLELSDLNQPLLTRLKTEASGSYYHSIDVAKLAEAAAEAIKANPLLARVGSYYHDIGKMTKPEYFIENQKGENLHDKLSPSMSSRIISSHVKDGIKVAKEYKLPQVIQDIIRQHHGNTLIGGLRFYQKAVESDKHNTVRIEDYRYPGPRPQTKESAIILLADSVESARHTMLHDDPSYSRLISFVREIVEDKTMDSQLDECDLTLKDVHLIIDAFVRVLSGMYHTRIEYPKELETASLRAKNGEKKEQNNGENR